MNQLRSLALSLSSEGLSRDAILERFEAARQELRAADRETDEDALLDVMDVLVGWCGPHMKWPVVSDVTRSSSCAGEAATTTTHVYRNFVFQIRYRPRDPAYVVEFPDLPDVITSGATLPEAFAHACEALDRHLEGLQKLGLPTPIPRRRVVVEAV